MKISQKSKWLLAAALFVLFIAAFLLDLTGLSLHQWIGVAAGALSAYHLITHWEWVKTVTWRFLGKTSNQARHFYLLDGVILGGFSAILLTGIVISTWLNLSLSNYPGWLAVHIAVSIGTLLAVAYKIALHWRWIVTVFMKFFNLPVPTPAVSRPAAGQAVFGRREFLKVMGVTGAAAGIALVKAVQGLQYAQAAALTNVDAPASAKTSADSAQAAAVESPTQSAAATQMEATTASTAELATTAASATATATTAASSVPTSQAATASSSSQAAATTCTVRCNKGCSFPGRCRRYTDSNGNNRCDLGECL